MNTNFDCWHAHFHALSVHNDDDGNRYGIRLEDVVLVTETGYEILSGNLAASATEP